MPWSRSRREVDPTDADRRGNYRPMVPRAPLVLIQYGKPKACLSETISGVKHVSTAVVIEDEGIFDHLGIPAGIGDIDSGPVVRRHAIPSSDSA